MKELLKKLSNECSDNLRIPEELPGGICGEFPKAIHGKFFGKFSEKPQEGYLRESLKDFVKEFPLKLLNKETGGIFREIPGRIFKRIPEKYL